jgi:hypothetical protein
MRALYIASEHGQVAVLKDFKFLKARFREAQQEVI